MTYHILVGFGPETHCGTKASTECCYADTTGYMDPTGEFGNTDMGDPGPNDCQDCWDRFALAQLAALELEGPSGIQCVECHRGIPGDEWHYRSSNGIRCSRCAKV